LDIPLPEALRSAGKELPLLTLAAVPVLWRTWHEAAAIPPQTGLAVSAGAPFPVLLEREIYEKWGIKVHNFYGASECGGIAYDDSLVPRTDDTCVGSPLARVTVAVNEVGCLKVEGRAVGEGYWPDADDSLGAGCFQTGDLCLLHEGHLFLRGRMGDQINVAGRKVSPAQIERILALHPAVRQCLVLGVPSRDADRHESIAAVVTPGGSVNESELRNFLLARLPAWQVPREWRFVHSLAENHRGKVSRVEWRRRLRLGP
jgi:acyl-coenzyme A synthetase/AMP-(fatty) acid ligase